MEAHYLPVGIYGRCTCFNSTGYGTYEVKLKDIKPVRIKSYMRR